MEEEIKKTLDDHEKRISELETIIIKKISTKKIVSVENVIEKIVQNVDMNKYQYIYKFDKVLDKSLTVLRMAKDDFDTDGLTPPQISKILTEKVRLKTTQQAVNWALQEAKTYVDKIPSGQTNKFRLMKPGELYLDKRIDEVKVEQNQ